MYTVWSWVYSACSVAVYTVSVWKVSSSLEPWNFISVLLLPPWLGLYSVHGAMGTLCHCGHTQAGVHYVFVSAFNVDKLRDLVSVVKGDTGACLHPGSACRTRPLLCLKGIALPLTRNFDSNGLWPITRVIIYTYQPITHFTIFLATCSYVTLFLQLGIYQGYYLFLLCSLRLAVKWMRFL